MGNKKSANSPLLYIQQPTTRTPEAPMQSSYKTPKKSDTKNQSMTTKSSVKRSGGRNSFFEQEKVENKHPADTAGPADPQANDDDNIEEKDASHNDTTSEHRKQFKDMSLQERVEYFLNRPAHVPPMRCEIKTNERRYRGIITDYQDETVYVRVGRRSTPTAISFSEIHDIQMVGF
ncbi:hypothetical protein GCM10008983_06740 [Lentibacillus halophilus]|uniref:Spore coat protein CotO n=1 Tax=Lentibacillus halophilus TaxID=295065 RepID=A0ABN0Z4J3_9BACI